MQQKKERPAGEGKALLIFEPVVSYETPQTDSRMTRVTTYGSQLALGRRSSMYPFLSWSTIQGIRTEAPRSDTPYLKSLYEHVS